MAKIIVHGFKDWFPSQKEFIEMLDTVQVGANGDCDVTIDNEKKTLREWQNDPKVIRKIRG